MTNEQQPADQGRGVGEVTIAMVLASMRNWAGVADRCAVTEGHAPSCIRIWADQLEAALAALTQPNGVSGPAVLAACNAYDLAAQLDGETGMDSAQYPWMHAALVAAQNNGWQVNGWRTVGADRVFTVTPPSGLLPAVEFVRYDAHLAALSLPRQSEALYAAAKSLIECVEGSGCLVWREATQGIRLKDTQEWVALYLAVKRADTTPQPAQADTTPAAHGVGDGMVVVPREASMRMLQAGSAAADGLGSPLTRTECAWNAMLQAASAPGGRDE